MSVRFRISEVVALTAITREQAPGKPTTKTAGRTGSETQKCQGKSLVSCSATEGLGEPGTLFFFVDGSELSLLVLHLAVSQLFASDGGSYLELTSVSNLSGPLFRLFSA